MTESAPKRGRGPGRPWPKGVSANPGGRRPVPPEIKDALRAAEPQAVNKLVELVSDPDPAIALKASLAIIERVRGKSPQALELLNPGGEGLTVILQTLPPGGS